MAGQKTPIYANDFNIIQSKIFQVLGSGSGDYGYGQLISSTQSTVTTPVSMTSWNNLRTDLLKAYSHQTGIDASSQLTVATNRTLITEADRAAYNAMADSIITNRLAIPPSSQATRSTLRTGVMKLPWNTNIIHTVTVNFIDVDEARFFFNSGSSIDISALKPVQDIGNTVYGGGTGGLKNNSWSTLLTNMGIISLRRDSSAVSGTGTISSNIGWSNLTTDDQLLFIKQTETPVYTPNRYDILVRRGNTAAQIIFTIKFEDLSVGNPDESNDGTLTSIVQAYRASGSNVSVASPSSTGSMVSDGVYNPPAPPSYNISVNSTIVNEGQSSTFTITTTNIANGTVLYWTTNGPVTGADFSDNILTGSVTINNNTAQIIRTIAQDNVQEAIETFSLSLRVDSVIGTIKANSDPVTIQGTTYSITPHKTVMTESTDTVIFTITTNGVPNGTSLYWRLNSVGGYNNVETADFVAMPNSYITIQNNTAIFSLTTLADHASEGTEAFSVSISATDVSPILATTAPIIINDTSIPGPTYSVIPSKTSLTEINDTVVFTVTTTSVPNGTSLFWKTNAVSGYNSVNTPDFISIPSSYITIQNNTASITLTTSPDMITEGTEAFTVSISATQGSPVLALSATVLINEAAPTVTYAVTPNRNTMTESNNVVIFTVTTTNVPNGTSLFWKTNAVSGYNSVDSPDFITIPSSYITIYNNTASITLTTSPDHVTEGTEAFTVSISASNGSSVLAISSPVIIDDTSRAATLKTLEFFYTGAEQYWTVPADVTSINAIIIAGGGGGGASERNVGSSNKQGGGGGGGAGGYLSTPITVIPNTLLNMHVGKGGTGAPQNTSPNIYKYSASVLVGNGAFTSLATSGTDSYIELPTAVRKGAYGGKFGITATSGTVPAAAGASGLTYTGVVPSISVPAGAGNIVANDAIVAPSGLKGCATGGTGGSLTGYGTGGAKAFISSAVPTYNSSNNATNNASALLNGHPGTGYGAGGGGAGVNQINNNDARAAYAGGDGSNGWIQITYLSAL